ncbi:MAG: hypothetical protein EPN20_15910 [Magnetospirillum sp.]|nr:MAG: hypothetical protein EPN20_15910 [Magnetospirillum sp.]
MPEPALTLSTGIATPIYSGERDRAHITALAGREGVGAARFNTGLTRSRAEVRITPQIWEVALGGGRRCIGLGRVEAHWRLDELLVDIASEYPPGGCNYRIIREHEDEHVAFARDAYLTWTPRIEATLRDAVMRVKPIVTTGDAKQVANDITARLMRALQPAIDGFRAELRSRNASIDTTANYRLVNSRCPKW